MTSHLLLSPVEQVQFVQDFYANYKPCGKPYIRDYVIELFGNNFVNKEINYEIVLAISNNVSLFNKYYNYGNSEKKGNKKYNLYQVALSAKDTDIIIYFTDLQLYYIAKSADDISKFINYLRENLFDYDKPDKIYIYQQLISNRINRKLTFIADEVNTEIDDILRIYAKDKFNSGISSIISDNQTQYTIENTDVSYNQSILDIEDIKDNLNINIRKPPIINVEDHIFTLFTIMKHRRRQAIPDICNILKSIHINPPPDVKIMDDNSNLCNHQVAREWIALNPPDNREKTTDYYTRYTSVNNNAVANNIFGKLVRQSGFAVLKSSGSRYYIQNHSDNI